MLKAWAVLVLCGLLPCSHGVAENILSAARLDKAVLENVLSDTLANGNLIQGLLGGGLLGGDLLGGLTGGILGGQGGGPLGGDVLGGLTEGILGGQGGGPLGGVLGGQGGGPLGGDGLGGLTGGILGGQGGGPLGGDVLGGLTEGILGGQEGGPLGGVLGGQGGGLLGGVLGGQGGGPLDGILGGQGGGPLGGIVGGQGGGLLGGELLGGLTEGVLGGRGGGLLGVLGGRGGLLGLKIVDIILPRVSLELLPGVGLGVNIYAKVAIDGNTVLSGLLNLMVEVNITARARLVQLESGAPRLVVENCRTNLGGVQILSGFLPLSLDRILTSVLNNVIPGVLCPVVDVVVNLVNALLGTVNSICPFGTLGKLHYTLAGLPLFSGQHIVLNLNLQLLDPQGNAVDLPAAQLPALPLPLAGNSTSQLLLSGDLLSSLLRLLVAKGGLNADITEQTLDGAVPLNTAALRSVLPEISQLLPADLPLVVKVRVSELPAVSLQNGQVTVSLTAAAEVFARTRAGLRALFGVEANIVLSGRVTITATRLAISLSLQSIGLRATSSEIGSFDVSGLTNWLTDILRIGYLPVINGALKIGIPLPNLLNLNLADAVVTTLQDTFVIDVPPKLH